MHPGTYQVIVHVIQAKALASAGSLIGSGVPDPMVAVTVHREREGY